MIRPLQYGALFVAVLLPYDSVRAEKVHVLTNSNFDHLTAHGTWLVDVFAPWCPHCRDLESTWTQLAENLQGVVNVSKIDATSERALANRFLSLEGFPAIFHIAGSETRQYTGRRTLEQLEDFAVKGWQEHPVLPFWKSPTSRLGRVFGQLLGLPGSVQSYYQHLHEDKLYSHLSLLAGLLAIPIILGLTTICCVDAYLTHPSTRR